MFKRFSALAVLFIFLSSCSSSQNGFRVAATPVPHAQMLDYVKPDLRAQGINLIIVVTDDYNMPNRALADHKVDANFFQHLVFMEEQIEQFHYPIESIAKIELEPMGIYSARYHSLSELPDNATIAIPNDPTNEARALLLLQGQGIIELDDPTNLHATLSNISDNPKQIRFYEVAAYTLPRAYQDFDAAAINTNFALEAKLSPLKDALVLENKDSPYDNVIAIRIGDEDRPEIVALKAAMTSDKMREFILNKYQGAVLPAF